jgi:hypothetical protein
MYFGYIFATATRSAERPATAAAKERRNEGAAPTRRFEALSLALGCRLKSVKQSELLH